MAKLRPNLEAREILQNHLHDQEAYLTLHAVAPWKCQKSGIFSAHTFSDEVRAGWAPPFVGSYAIDVVQITK